MSPSSLLRACELELARAVRTGRTFAVVVLQPSGSRALAAPAAARRLRARVREFDTVVVDRRRGRVAVLVPELRAGELATVCDRYRRSAGMTPADPCVGVLYPSDGRTADQLLAACDERLSRALGPTTVPTGSAVAR